MAASVFGVAGVLEGLQLGHRATTWTALAALAAGLASSCSSPEVTIGTFEDRRDVELCGSDGIALMWGCYFEAEPGESCTDACSERGGCIRRYMDSTDLVIACLAWHPDAEDLEVEQESPALPYFAESYEGSSNVCVSRVFPANNNTCDATVADGRRACQCDFPP